MVVTKGNEAAAYKGCGEVGRELEPAWLAVCSVQRAKIGEVRSFCIERGGILASDNTIGKEGRVGDSRDAGKESDNGKKGGKPRILQCPLEEGEYGDWEVDDEELEANELM
jgi:hypothetical protein